MSFLNLVYSETNWQEICIFVLKVKCKQMTKSPAQTKQMNTDVGSAQAGPLKCQSISNCHRYSWGQAHWL